MKQEIALRRATLHKLDLPSMGDWPPPKLDIEVFQEKKRSQHSPTKWMEVIDF